ncbi:CBS domain-containing protein, partial [Candidatus Woesearchaeota archaeon]|nr:CBS domain-containing protein [Candidatus Woesearchaeota archaeon]
YTADSSILPIIAKKQVIGVVRNIDIVNQLKNTKIKNKKINEIMTLRPITIKENDRTGKAIEIIREKKVSRLPIVDDKGELLSVTSVTDILQLHHVRQQGSSERGSRDTANPFFKQGKGFDGDRVDLHSYPIKNLTSPITITGNENDSVSTILDEMNEYEISSLVIVKDKKPIGIVTIRDLLKLFMKEKITF